RVYNEADVIQLQQILSLRQIGLPLDEIRVCLRERGITPIEVVRMHRSRVVKEREHLGVLQDRLSKLESALTAHQVVSVEEFIKTIEVIQMHEKYFTKEQLQEFESRKHELGEEKLTAVQKQWEVLIAKVRSEMEKGTDPTTPHVQELAAEWNSLVLAFTGGNPKIEYGLQNMYMNEPKMRERAGLDAKMFEY